MEILFAIVILLSGSVAIINGLDVFSSRSKVLISAILSYIIMLLTAVLSDYYRQQSDDTYYECVCTKSSHQSEIDNSSINYNGE